MKHLKTNGRGKFDVLHQSRSAQAAMMTLRPGGTSDEDVSNEHAASEQWVFVISGSGEVVVGKSKSALQRAKIRDGSLLLIEKGELHQIKNTGRRQLVTLNFYVPPAYDAQGDPR
jgi:mannose-6-phosphate isomerase-like protein (cupin superfamily)